MLDPLDALSIQYHPVSHVQTPFGKHHANDQVEVIDPCTPDPMVSLADSSVFNFRDVLTISQLPHVGGKFAVLYEPEAFPANSDHFAGNIAHTGLLIKQKACHLGM